jgi:hypothetical protein
MSNFSPKTDTAMAVQAIVVPTVLQDTIVSWCVNSILAHGQWVTVYYELVVRCTVQFVI